RRLRTDAGTRSGVRRPAGSAAAERVIADYPQSLPGTAMARPIAAHGPRRKRFGPFIHSFYRGSLLNEISGGVANCAPPPVTSGDPSGVSAASPFQKRPTTA